MKFIIALILVIQIVYFADCSTRDVLKKGFHDVIGRYFNRD